MMFKKIIIQPMLAAVIVTALFGAATQAQAESVTANGATVDTVTVVGPQAVQDCPSKFACLWTSTGWSGSRWQGQFRNNTLPSSIDNKSLSSANHGQTSVACFWTDPSGRGQVLAEGLGSIRQNLALDPRPGGGNWANIISSLTWGNC
jgi:hypothetical protein